MMNGIQDARNCSDGGNHDISQDEYIDCVYSNGQLEVSYTLETNPCSHESASSAKKHREKVLFMCRGAVLRAERKIGHDYASESNKQALWDSLRDVLMRLGPSLKFLEKYKQFSSLG
ncbi:MAG: hypothetical protein WCT48_05820 [Candidatus Paceibacterota bacterium]